MRDYGKVHSSFWTSDDIRQLSDDGKLLAIYLLTGPHSTQLGAFRLPDGYVSEDMGWSTERVSKGFDELSRKGFATRFEPSKWVVIHNFLKWNEIENPNQGKSAAKLFEQIPDQCPAKPVLARILRDFAPRFPVEALNRFETLTQTVPEPYRNQEQEQEQEQEVSAEPEPFAEPLQLRCPDSPETIEGPTPIFTLPCIGGIEAPILQADLDEWSATFPAVEVVAELRRMRTWLHANPTQRKTVRGVNRFVVTWLGRQQDRPRSGSGTRDHAEAKPWEGAI